ncbi:MAG: response regulator transcription factor [Trueperaceae bacterium]
MTTTDPRSTTSERPAAGARLLVVEDDRQLVSLLREQLQLAGYDPAIAMTLAEARELLADQRFELVILDLNLPDGDGLDLAEEISAGSKTPMLMLTARGDVESRVAGLYAGASDYLTKPFSVAELLARVHVRLREQGGQQRLELGDLVLDVTNGTATVAGVSVILPEREFKVLKLLVQYRGRVFTKEDLERALYGPDLPDSNTIEVFVYNLRRKLKAAGMDGVIRTVRNRGYLVV